MMKAVIMAGGEGSRLRPLTCDLPKPMVPVMNIPIMEQKIELLDGVKFIRENCWALVLPDADKPMLRVYSEGLTPTNAEDISDFYIDKIKTILNASVGYMEG